MATVAPFKKQGERITAAREKAGLSKMELARRLSRTNGHNASHGQVEATRKRLNRAEAGKHQPKADFLVAIAEHTGASLAELLNGDDEEDESLAKDLAFLAAFRAWVADGNAERERVA